MVGDRRGVLPLAILAALGCGGATRPATRASTLNVAGRFPVSPCDGAAHPDAVGVYQTADREAAFVYDGCTVRFVHTFGMEPPMFLGLRDVAGAFVVDVRDYAEPFPYFRAPASWRGPGLRSVSLLIERDFGRWDGVRFVAREGVYQRVERAEDLTDEARALLGVDRVVPTETELAERCGVPMPGPEGLEASYPERMLGPRGCDEYQRRAAE